MVTSNLKLHFKFFAFCLPTSAQATKKPTWVGFFVAWWSGCNCARDQFDVLIICDFFQPTRRLYWSSILCRNIWPSSSMSVATFTVQNGLSSPSALDSPQSEERSVKEAKSFWFRRLWCNWFQGNDLLLFWEGFCFQLEQSTLRLVLQHKGDSWCFSTVSWLSGLAFFWGSFCCCFSFCFGLEGFKLFFTFLNPYCNEERRCQIV